MIVLQRSPTAGLFCAFFSTLFFAIFNYTLSLMASPYIAGDLGGSNDITTYTVSFYALGNALGIPLGRALLGKIGTARFLVITMALSGLFSLACATATDYVLFNTYRFMQGFVAGPFYALVFYLFQMLQPQAKKALYTSIILAIFTIGPVVGACWGGWIAYEWNWRLAFYANVPFQLFLAYYFWRRLKGFDAYPTPNPPFDRVGYLSYTIAIFCLGFALIMGQELDWLRSHTIVVCFLLGGISFLFFIFWEIYHPYPLLYLNLLKNPVLCFALLNLAILFSAYFGMVVLLALWLTLWVNYTPDWIGVLLGTMAIAGFFPFFLIERKMGKVDNRLYLILAIVLLAISCFHTMTFNIEINFGRIAFSRILAGFGLALFLAPIFRLCFHGYPQEKLLHVLGLFQVVRALSSGLGASIYATIWLRRQVFYHDRLGSQLTAASPQTQEFFLNAEKFHLHGEHAEAQLEDYLQREATSLALDDCFYLMAWLLIGLLVVFALTLLLRRRSLNLS